MIHTCMTPTGEFDKAWSTPVAAGMRPAGVDVGRSHRVLGSISTAFDPVSERLDLSRALTALEVADLLSNLPQSDGDKPWRWWGPRLALAMALPLKRVAQLDTRQLRFRGERVWIDFPSMQRKGAQRWSVRSMPVHPSLITAGFAQFAHARYFSEGREGPLFPDLAGAARPGDAMESWLRRSTGWLRPKGHHAPTFADLRTTCAQAALDGGASVVAVETLMGREGEYASDRGPFDPDAARRLAEDRLIEAIDAVNLPGLEAYGLAVALPTAGARGGGTESRSPHGS